METDNMKLKLLLKENIFKDFILKILFLKKKGVLFKLSTIRGL